MFTRSKCLKFSNVLLCGVFLLSALLSACSSKDPIVAKELQTAGSKELFIAAAADLMFAMDAVVDLFNEIHPDIRVRITYGSSGNFYSQIKNKAPYDLYFSADIRYPKGLAESGLAWNGEVFEYAIGRIVLWLPEATALPVQEMGKDLMLSPQVQRIAIANPRHAPYGEAAVAALHHLGLYREVESRLVFGENIAQAAHFVQSGSADIGIIALSLALSPALSSGTFWEFPFDSYPLMLQGGMILKSSQNHASAEKFRDFVLGMEGRLILNQFGFYIPGEEF